MGRWFESSRGDHLFGRDVASARIPYTVAGRVDSFEASFDDLARKLVWRRSPDGAGRFLSIYLEQNNTCNLKCRMCGFSDPRVAALPRSHMPARLYESIARQIFPLATYLHMSLMTEPFMTPDFPERLLRVREYGVPYSLVVTNGTLLTPRAIARVLDAQITTLAVSLDGGTAEVYEDIRVGARFDAVLRNIDVFRRMRAERGLTLPNLRINHVLMERNIDHFPDFLALLARLRPELVDVRIIQPMSYTTGNECHDPAFFRKIAACKPMLADCCAANGIEDCGYIRDQAAIIELRNADGSRMTCRRPWDTVAIHANGDVFPCVSWTRAPLGNLGEQSFEEIWHGAEAGRIRREFDALAPGVDCQHCTIKKNDADPIYDDFFFRLVNKQPAE